MTVLVLCLNLGRTYTFHCRRKSKRSAKWLGFLVDVWFWSALTVTLNQRVRVRVSTAIKTYLMSGVNTTLDRTGSLTLPRLCQNYVSLCVRIGKNRPADTVKRMNLPRSAVPLRGYRTDGRAQQFKVPGSKFNDVSPVKPVMRRRILVVWIAQNNSLDSCPGQA